MKLRDILNRDLPELFGSEENDQVKHIFIEVPEELLKSTSLALESYWKASGYKDYMMRIDPPNPGISLQRHVHIAKRKHIHSKYKQVSWNADGSRHDKKSFDEKSAKRAVQDIARKALKLDVTATLESIGGQDRGCGFQEKVLDILDDLAIVRVSAI